MPPLDEKAYIASLYWDGGHLLREYKRYIEHLKKQSKKLWIFFWACLILLLLVCTVLAIFSPDDRRFAVGMLVLGLLGYAFIHFAGFWQYIKRE